MRLSKGFGGGVSRGKAEEKLCERIRNGLGMEAIDRIVFSTIYEGNKVSLAILRSSSLQMSRAAC